MIGSIRWNIFIGLTGFVLTFLFSFTHNVFLTTLLRSVYCFFILFIFVFLVRWVLGTLIGLNEIVLAERSDDSGDHLKGTVVDYVTPDEKIDFHDHLKPEEDSETAHFSQLQVPRLTTKMNPSPENLAKAIRRVTED